MDHQIRHYFSNRKFASLEYLSKEESWAENENNLGRYFFLLDLKQEETSDVFKKILDVKGNHAAAYSYLGDIARQLFVRWYERKIPIYYFKEALKHADNDSHILWSLYILTYEPGYFLSVVKINYKVRKFKSISNYFLNTPTLSLIQANFEKKDWLELKDICLNENIEHSSDLLMICYFYLEEFEEAIRVMDKRDRVNKAITDLYLEAEIIDNEYAVKKCDYHERLKYLNGDSSRIYEEAKKEAERGKANPTKECLIKFAFEANEYSDVMSLVDEYAQSPVNIKNQVKLYHILSSLYLDLSLNEQYEKDINYTNFFRGSHCNPLYLGYLVLRNIKKLETQLREKKDLHDIKVDASYQDAQEYLDHDDLLTHYLHGSLVDMLNTLKNEWDLKVANFIIESLQGSGNKLNEEDQTNLATSLINVKRYDEAILLLNKLPQSMSNFNSLAVCNGKLGDVDSALKNYELSIAAMEFNGAFEDIILSNYLTCLSKSSRSISEKSLDKYKDMFNKGITSYFTSDFVKHRNGKSLFKYYPFNQFTLDALVNEYFYLAASEQLNDPIELPYEKLSAEKDDIVFRPNFRLASFSSNENSMLMWSHYAENHTGLMVEYFFDGELPDGVGMGDVKYSNTIKRFKEKDLYLFDQYMLTKNKDWSYEQELRLFSYNRDKIYYRNYSYPNQDNDKAPAYIRSITVGYKFPESTIKLIQSIIDDLNKQRDKKLPAIELRKAELSEKNFFELEYKVIR